MDALDKISWLTDKRCGLGIPLTTIGRYCGVHPTTVHFHLTNQGPAKLGTLDKYENGIKKLVEDFKKNMIDVD